MTDKILIVHDEQAARVGLAATLVDAGYDTIAVGSLGTALHALSEDQPDLLIAGLHLGGSSGLQLLAMNPRRIPAILLSDFADHVLEAEARHLGADYMVAPVSPDALVDLVRHKLTLALEGTFSPARRWTRKSVAGDWHVQVADSPARVIDVSYGGVCIEVQRAPGAWLPLSVRLVVPTSGTPVEVDIVWKRRNGDETWVCGAAIAEANQAAWRRVVDSLS